MYLNTYFDTAWKAGQILILQDKGMRDSKVEVSTWRCMISSVVTIIEPAVDKTYLMHVWSEKAKVSLRISAVFSAASLLARDLDGSCV